MTTLPRITVSENHRFLVSETGEPLHQHTGEPVGGVTTNSSFERANPSRNRPITSI